MVQLVPQTASAVEEQSRLMNDGKFWRKFLYFFELEMAPSAGEDLASAIMPLMLAPQRMIMGEPFAVTVTPTLGGGLYVEEDGIIARPIQIAGTTGFAPRLLSVLPNATTRVRAELRSYHDRTLPVPAFVARLSGQKQLQMLQDRIFRLYADLKRNPETAAGTKLFWHNVKDDEHWRVIPQSLTIRRASPRSTMYFYDITMLAVEPAVHNALLVSEDRSLFEQIGDAARSIREGIDLISGTIDNVAGVIRDFNDAIRNFAGAVQSATSILAAAGNVGAAVRAIESPIRTAAVVVEAARDFLNGATGNIQGVTTGMIKTLIADVERVTDAMDSAIIAGVSFPAAMRAEWADIQRGCERIAAWPDRLQSSVEARVSALSAQSSTSAAESAAATRQTSFQAALRRQGTGVGPGDAAKQRARRLARDNPRAMAGASERTVGQNQTIQDLAALYLGDSARWPEIAALNDLQAPYVHSAGLPRTLRPGDTVLIPARATSSRAATLPVVRGTDTMAPEAERLFGVDWRLAPAADGSGLYDMVLSEGRDAGKDVKAVAGVANLEQAVGTRLRTSKGDSALYRGLGTDVVIGVGNRVVDEETARLRLAAAVQADPRIVSISGLLHTPRSPDTVDVEFDAAVYGLAERVSVMTRI